MMPYGGDIIQDGHTPVHAHAHVKLSSRGAQINEGQQPHPEYATLRPAQGTRKARKRLWKEQSPILI
jgi:hypothetical protein